MHISTEFHPLSQPQKSIWYLEKTYPETSMNVIAGTLRLKCEIDYAVLEEAVNLFIKNHDAMRIHIVEQNGQPGQYITEYNRAKIDFFDFSKGSGLSDLYAWDEQQTKIPFNLIDSDLYYFAMIKINETDGGFYIKTHHLISDAWSMSILGGKIVDYYSVLKAGNEIPDENNPSYLEILSEEEKYLSSDRFLKDKAYWGTKFEPYPEPVRLKPQTSSNISTKSKRKTLLTPAKLSRKIREYCAENKLSIFTLFLAALSMYINRTVEKEDIILGTAILNRVNQREKDTMGMYASIGAPIRINVNGELDFKTFTEEMTKESISILRHQKYPYNFLLQDVKKKHNVQSSLFDMVLIYQNSKFRKEKSKEEYTTRWHFAGHQLESLTISINDRDDDGCLILDYDFLTDVFNIKEIEFIHQHVISLLWHALDNPLKKISKLEMLSEKEKQKILYEFNNTKAEFPRDKTLHQIFEEQAERFPDRVAVVSGEKKLTYRELNEKSNQLARLLREKGVGPDKVVGLSLYRSAEMIVGLLGILKAGGAYLPINPDHPQDRIRYMLEDSGAMLLLTNGSISDGCLPETELIHIEEENIYQGDVKNPERLNTPKDLCYVIYTSGSTGRPKGAMIEHQSIVNRLHWMQKKYPLSGESAILQKTPFTFDVSVWELFWWSFVGAKVCMLEPGGERDPGVIINAIEKNQITTMHFVPSMLSAFLDYVEKRSCAGRLSTLKQVFSSGEALTVAQTDTFNRLLYTANGTQLYNLYGPTEAAVDVSYFDCSPGVTLKTVPIGRPIDNIRLYILDRNRNLLPVGIPGELYIGGIGVGRGYINNPKLTAERFIEDPFYPGEVIYKTGDRVRWFPEGDIEYLGRIDFQVKIRGIRIEIGEIESRLLSHDAVKDAVVVGITHNNSICLCAYIVADGEMKSSEIREHLSKDLPEYMIPSFFIFLNALPLSSNGKVDRKALPSPDFSKDMEDEYIAPENETEKALAAICCTILELERVSVNESFFKMGGDSLRAIALITEIHREFSIELSVRDVFRLHTVRHLAEFIAKSGKSSCSPIPKLAENEYYPVSSSQKRLFILSEFEKEDISYNLPGVLLVEGTINRKRVEEVFKALIDRHWSLRTTFEFVDGYPVQRVHEVADFEVRERCVSENEIADVINAFIRPFNLNKAPLLRVELIKLDKEKYLLLFDMHHIISDGTSINILIKEFAGLYAQKELPELKIQYTDYSAWHHELLKTDAMKAKESYWLNRFSDELPILNMPTDFPRPARKSFSGKRLSLVIEEEVTTELKKTALATGTTLYMVLLASYTVLLSKYASQEDIIIGMPIEGRLHADLQDVIGMFVNTLAIRNFPEGGKTFLQFLQEVKATLLEAFENQEYPFEALVEKAKVKRDQGRNPLFDISFVLQNVDLTQIKFSDLTFTPYPFDGRASKFDIALEAFDRGRHIDLVAEYCTDLFEEETIERLLGHFLNLLKDVVCSPWKRLSEINILSEEEKHQLLYEFNDTAADFPKEKTVHQIFEEQSERTPENIAVSFGEFKLTYRELNERSNRLARTLRQKGVGPDTIVAISVYRSVEMIIGMLAVIKAGGAYLPIDPDYPEDRISFMLKDSGTKLLLTQKSLMVRLQPDIGTLCLDEESSYSEDASNLENINSPQDLLYIIYTSGSTGEPKGVMIEHRNVVRLLFNSRFQFSFSDQDVWTMFHSFCFDFSVWEMYGALLYGANLVIISKEAAMDTGKFLGILKTQKVTVLNQTPAAFYNLIQEELLSPDHTLMLRYVIFGGEALKPIQLKPFHKIYPCTKLINMYGITETTVHVTFKEIGESEIENNISNVGKAIPTLKTYILDKYRNLLPVGIPGELCVSGDGVSRGYLYNEELTGKKFIKSLFSENETMYRSGDLARIMPGGDIEYLGRIDNQVKIRGYRIELGEIESALLKHPDIKEALVIPRENQSGDKKLYLYYVSNRELHPSELRGFLLGILPEYMIPSFFVHLEKMPLNRNGKIDRALLSKTNEVSKFESNYIEPRNETEKMLANIFAEVLELTKVGIQDDFFDLGGDSLSAIKIISNISKFYNHVSLVDFYSSPTVMKLAEKIALDNGRDGANTKLLVPLMSGADKKAAAVICFPYGGGNAISYKALGESISKSSDAYSLYAVNLPGHDIGDDSKLMSVKETALQLRDEIQSSFNGEIVLYGHCVGSALLIETARLLEKENRKISRIFIGGIFPPKFVRLYGSFFDPWMLFSDKKVINYLNNIGLKKSSFDNEYADFILNAFRHDARSFYRYFYSISKNIQKLKTPICCVVGDSDPMTKNYRRNYKGWSLYSGEVSLYVLRNADHYFINSHACELAPLITKQPQCKEQEAPQDLLIG